MALLNGIYDMSEYFIAKIVLGITFYIVRRSLSELFSRSSLCSDSQERYRSPALIANHRITAQPDLN